MKKGISLIVLVITIIIMIIIAGAIILSLSSNNTTANARWATLSSDRANYQASYATLYGDYMIAESKGEGPAEITIAQVLQGKAAKDSKGEWFLDDGDVKFKPSQTSSADLEKQYGITAAEAPNWIIKTDITTN